MEEADDINRVEGDRGALDGASAVDGIEPEQSVRAQQATANELKRLESRNIPGRAEDLEVLQDRRRRESNLGVSKAQHEILVQNFQEQLEDLEENQALGRRTEEQLRRAFRELRTNELQLTRATNELTSRQAKVGAVEEAQGLSRQMLQFEARVGGLRQQLGPEITGETGSVRSHALSSRSTGGISRASSTSSHRRLMRSELEKKRVEESMPGKNIFLQVAKHNLQLGISV